MVSIGNGLQLIVMCALGAAALGVILAGWHWYTPLIAIGFGSAGGLVGALYLYSRKD